MISNDFRGKENTWLKTGIDCDFSVFNIPFGIARLTDGSTIAASRIGDYVINLHALNRDGYFDEFNIRLDGILSSNSLNDFIAMGKSFTNRFREKIQELLKEDSVVDQRDEFFRKYLLSIDNVKMQMPVKVNEYTDFYSSFEHATNVGSLFRDASDPLPRNWRHLPIGYHGRASSIVVSGTNIHRPKGQILPLGQSFPILSSSKKLDFELELAFITGKETALGTSIPIEKAEEYIFGVVLFNDLSARDIQSWEYVPLGPFLSKNFGSVISPWIVTLEALEPYRTEGPNQDPEVLPYLKTRKSGNFDINLEAHIQAEGDMRTLVSATNFRFMYWNMSQQLAHHTINGCNINVGDLYASGTISGNVPGSYGSLLELTQNGKNPIKIASGDRTFLEDYDKVIFKAYAKKENIRIGFGDCETTILPSI